MRNCFTDVSSSAPWWDTYLQSPPWNPISPPSLVGLCGFRLDMVQPDLLHVLNLGVGRMLAGSILTTVLKEKTVFPGGTIPEQLASATESFGLFCRSRGFQPRMKKITLLRLNWKKDTYAELTCSGYDNYTICLWLQHTLEDHSGRYPEFSTLLWALNNAMSVLYGAGRFLTPDEKERVHVLGSTFLRSNMQCASRAVQENKFLFRVTPKLHALQHVLQTRRTCNLAKFATWMDEDFLRRMARVLEITSSLTSQKRTLQRWLLQLPECWRKLSE